MGILSLNLIPLPSPHFFGISSSSLSIISQAIKYCLSITPKLYELAPTPEDITIEEIEAQATTEESYVEAMVQHAAWKEARAAVEWEEKSRSDCEVRAVKVEALKQKAEEKSRAEEKRKEEEWEAEEK